VFGSHVSSQAWWAAFTWFSYAAIAVALVAVVLAVGLSRAALIQLRKAISPSVADATTKLKRLGAEERRAGFSAFARDAMFEQELIEALNAPEPAMRVAGMNEALVDLESTLASRAHWGASATRLLMFVGALVCVAALIRLELIAAVIVLVLVVLGGAITLQMSSRAREVEKAQRKLADELIDLLSPGLPERRRRTREEW
jgi:ABC-type multidrug transport system fused ATPase/permease subunit